MEQILSRYSVRRELGRGGMGIVYEAHDARLNRTVAVKILQQDRDIDDRRRRFRQEARAASALNHPNIVTVYDIDSSGNVDYIVMEYVEGQPLSALLAAGPLPLETALRYAADIAGALAAAHAAGIVHRDVKPANVMVGTNGRIKVLDFGLSKVIRTGANDDGTTRSMPPRTERGVIAGTGGYMSPEQATGDPVDTRSDVFSLGVVLYEMLAGRRAFAGDSYWSTLRAILTEAVPPLTDVRPEVPSAISRIVDRCLEKQPADRYPSAVELAADLASLAPSRRTGMAARIRAHRGAAAGIGAAVLAVLAMSAIPLARWRSERSLEAALQEIEESVDRARYAAAYRVARALQQKAPDDPRVERALLGVTVVQSLRTDPPGAELFYKDFGDEGAPWERFGTTPLENARVPFGAIRWKIEKAGFDAVERRFSWWGERPLRLHRTGSAPPGMVFVPPGSPAGGALPNDPLGEFWIDKYEVTNAQFKRFVDEGGYRDERFWNHPFVKDGEVLSWEQAMALFRDVTGRPGPATWEMGTYPEGQADYPVGGVSWYEAAAFAEFTGKALPTALHWVRATGPGNLRDDIKAGNFASSAAQPVRQLKDLGAFGTYGMSGNIKEWCFNLVEGQRYLLGGGWNEPIYMATNLDARPPFDRAATNGFRTVKYVAPPTPTMLGEFRALPRHLALPRPVGDEVFDAYRSFYAYDRTPLDARIERVEESEHWRKETVTMAAPYGRDRLIVHLLLPKNAEPPFQAVIYYPGSYAYALSSSDELPVPIYFDFIARSGRALVHPVYQGTYERRLSDRPQGRARRDMIIDSSKDLGRTIDYLETRRDIDAGRLAFYVFSTAAQILPAVALEPRLKTAVFLSAGLGAGYARRAPQPEIDPVNFASRVRVPVLLLGGRYDFVLPVETAQRPFFAMLGTPAADKRHFLYDAGHVPPRVVLIRETLDWLDRYLGPVRARASAR